ncbi:MAG TPA: hypothetical protein VLC98_11605 [Phnomibacter sp.]|nr:hypothetical protein [Phnomibacter sp.]
MTREQKHKNFYTTSVIIGLLLLMLEIGLYQKTIIPIWVILTVILISSTITFFILRKDYQETYLNKKIIYPIAQSVGSFGFITCYLFMAINFQFANKETTVKTVSIISKNTIGTKNPRPAINIDYDGTVKQIVFSSIDKSEVAAATAVILTVKKGFFGYDVLYGIQLK